MLPTGRGVGGRPGRQEHGNQHQQHQLPPMHGGRFSRYQRQLGSSGGGGGGTRWRATTGHPSTRTTHDNDEGPLSSQAALAAQMRRAKQIRGNALDRDVMRVQEFALSSSSSSSAPSLSSSNNALENQNSMRIRRGWLYNVLPTTVSHLGHFSQPNAKIDRTVLFIFAVLVNFDQFY